MSTVHQVKETILVFHTMATSIQHIVLWSYIYHKAYIHIFTHMLCEL